MTSFLIRNEGSLPLLVRNLRVGCSCAGIFLDENCTKICTDSFDVSPNSERTLFLRVNIQQGGNRLTNLIVFQTNDPDHPNFGVSVKIDMSRIFANPRLVSFGSLSIGSLASQKIVIESEKDSTVRVVKAIHSSGDMISTDLCVVDQTFSDKRFKSLATIQLSPRTNVPRSLDGELKVFLDNGEIIQIPTFGKVLHPIEFSPKTLSIRATDFATSQPVSCEVKSLDGEPIEVSEVRSPAYLSTRVACNWTSCPVLEIGLKKAGDGLQPKASEQIDLVVTHRKVKYPISIRIYVHD